MTQNIVSLSGGKDSTALLLLAIERDTPNLTAVFADTGNEHPITYEYVRYLECLAVPIKWVKADFTARIAQKREYILNHWAAKGVPDHIVSRAVEVMQPTGIPFLDLCLWKNRFPSTKARFCSEELKKNPILEQVVYPYLDSGHDVESWQGVRADESDSRAKLKEHEYVLSRPFEDVDAELWNYRPILTWTAQDCFDMHKRHGINHNPLYELGMGRVGCMPCIHARKAELLEIVKRFPEEIERIAEWERIRPVHPFMACVSEDNYMTYQLHHGDCLQLMPVHIPDESIDLILCDLPYGTTECTWDSIIPLEPLWAEYKRIIKPNGAIVLTAMQPFASILAASNLQMFRYEWIWEKGSATGFLNAKIQPLRAHENILVFYKALPTFNPQKTTGHPRQRAKRRSVDSECYGKALKLNEYDSTDRNPRSVQFFSSDKQLGANFHPTQKPVALMKYLIETYTNTGDMVLDNTMGSGTTGLACLLSGRNFIGMEKEQKYFDAAAKRLADFVASDLFGGAA